MYRMTITAATLALALAACGTGTPAETDPTDGTNAPESTPPTTASPDVTASPGDGMSGDVDQELIDEAIEVAAAETGVSADEIEVVTAEAVTWPDGAIGCPEEGMGYTQALVPGYRVILDIDGEEIHLHAGSDGQFFPCDDPQPPADDGNADR